MALRGILDIGDIRGFLGLSEDSGERERPRTLGIARVVLSQPTPPISLTKLAAVHQCVVGSLCDEQLYLPDAEGQQDSEEKKSEG